jgi:hypothetical protein
VSYSDTEKVEALIRLAINKYDYQKTANETGLLVRTLRRWDKSVPKKGIADLLERAIGRLLMTIPDNMDGQHWAVAVGILMDKWLLINGQATSRTENIFGFLAKLSDDELDGLYAEFKEAASRGVPDQAGEGQAVTSLAPGPDSVDHN